MDGVERDGDITINVGFGNITFYRDATGPYALAAAEFIMKPRDNEKRDSKLELTMRFSCSPGADTILDVVEQSRQQAVALLRTAADHLEAETAKSLTYRAEDPSPEEA